MSKKVLTGAMAAIIATGMVTPALAATTDELYVAAYKAMEKAVAEKTQVAINEFRVAAKAILAVEGLSQEAKNNVATWSTMVDAVQLPFMVKVVDGLKALEAGDFKQADVNALYELIKDMPAEYKDGANYGWSQQTDKFQDELTMAALSAVEKATTAEEIAAAQALVADLKTSVNTDAATAAGKLEAALVEKATVKVEKVEVVGAKKVLVTFNKAVDTTKAVVTMKKGTISTNVEKFTFADDKKSVLVETTTKLTAGDYTVSVSGLTEKALTATVKAADEKVAKINVLTTTAPMVTQSSAQAKVKYEILNQYGEDVTTANYGLVSWNSSTGVAVGVGNGELTITNAGNNTFIPGAKVYLTGVHAATGTVVNAEVVVGLESKVDTVEFKGVYNTTTSKIEALPAGFANDKYVLLFQAKDQYGNKMNLTNLNNLVFTTNNPLFVANSFVQGSDVTIDGVTYNTVKLVGGSSVNNGGTATIQAISTVSGKTASYTVEANALSSVKTFSMSAPEVMIADGDKVEVPFTAADQYGNAVVKYSALSSIQFTSTRGHLGFEEQNDGTAKLYFHAYGTGATDTQDAPIYLTGLVPNGGSFSSLMVNVKAAAKPVAIVGLDKDVATNVAVGNSVEIKAEDLIVQDQYGRIMSDDDVKDWVDGANNVITVASNTEANSAFDVTSGNLIDSTSSILLTAKVGSGLDSSEKLVFTLAVSGTEITSSAKSITFNRVVQSEYVSYQVDDLGVIYNTTSSAAHAKTVKVYGVKADGTKVLLPASYYTVVTNSAKVTYSANKLVAGYATTDLFETNGDYKGDKKVQILVTVNDANGAAASIIEKELVVSGIAPKVETITLDGDKVSNGKTVAQTSGNALSTSALTSVIKEVKDQYGVVNTTSLPTVTITNLVKVDGSRLSVTGNGTTSTAITGAVMGDKFTVTYKYASGKTVSVDFTIGLDTATTRTLTVAPSSILTITN